MSTRNYYNNVIDAMALPQIVQLRDNLYCAKFQLVKILPARLMIRRAREAGLIKTGSRVIDTTSGTFALAIAMVCRVEGYRLTIVSDPAIDSFLAQRLSQLGVELVVVAEPAERGGYQASRLEKLAELMRRNPDAYWTCQYDNPENREAFHALGAHLANSLGKIDILVGAVGSGGTICGTSGYLRSRNPELHVVGIDSYGSVLFGQPDRPRLLRGAGSSLVFGNVDHTAFDEVHWVTAAEAFASTRKLYAETALFMGGTSGAAYMIGRWYAEQNPRSTVVTIFPDEGFRYQHTVYSENWLRENNVWLDGLPDAPREITTPSDGRAEWSRMHWNRRGFKDVVGELPPRFGLDELKREFAIGAGWRE